MVSEAKLISEGNSEVVAEIKEELKEPKNSVFCSRYRYNTLNTGLFIVSLHHSLGLKASR